MRCVMCGRTTLPAFMLGAEAVGPKCARAMGLSAKKLPPGSRIQAASTPATRKAAAGERRRMFTPDLFDNLETPSND